MLRVASTDQVKDPQLPTWPLDFVDSCKVSSTFTVRWCVQTHPWTMYTPIVPTWPDLGADNAHFAQFGPKFVFDNANFARFWSPIVSTLPNLYPNPPPIVPTLFNFGPSPPPIRHTLPKIKQIPLCSMSTLQMFAQIHFCIVKGKPR